MNIVHVSRAELRNLFVKNGVWTALQQQAAYKCEAKDKVSIPVKAGHTPAGGVQIIHKWSTPGGRHMVTTHSVLDADGWPVHWDEKDLIVGDKKYVHDKRLD